MKKGKLIVLWGLTFVAGALVGGSVMTFWPRPRVVCPACHVGPQAQLLLAQLENSGLPDGLREVANGEQTLKSSAEIPSQLVRTELPEDMVIGGEVATSEEPETRPAGVVLSDGQNTVVLNAQKPAQRAADGTNITMIEAPVQTKRIQTLDEYKAFKREARGSYPAADFATEEVIVLESASNLPDKVFEIVDITPEGDSLKVRYRVNVFGLGDKINTHSAQKISKTAAPLILEQVL